MTEYNIIDKKRGDTWKGLTITIPNKNITDAAIRCQFRRNSPIGTLEKEVSVGSGITITDAVNGAFKLDGFDVDFKPGLIHYDVEVTIANVITTVAGGTWTILQDVTH